MGKHVESKWIKDPASGKRRPVKEKKVYQSPPEAPKALDSFGLFAKFALIQDYGDHKHFDNILQQWENSLGRGLVLLGVDKEEDKRAMYKPWTGARPSPQYGRQVFSHYEVSGTRYTHKFRVINPLPVMCEEGEEITTKWHGTGVKNGFNIFKEGRLKPGTTNYLLLGPGIYLGNKDKAQDYCARGDSYRKVGNSRIDGLLLKVNVAFGRTHEQIANKYNGEDVDTIVGVPGVTKTTAGLLVRPEWCVRVPERVSVQEIWLRETRERNQHG